MESTRKMLRKKKRQFRGMCYTPRELHEINQQNCGLLAACLEELRI